MERARTGMSGARTQNPNNVKRFNLNATARACTNSIRLPRQRLRRFLQTASLRFGEESPMDPMNQMYN